jgi:hypothetical protein
MDPQTRQDLVFAVAFALGRCRVWLRAMITPHNADEAQLQAAEVIVRQIERSNFKVEQGARARLHSTLGGPPPAEE